MDAKELAIVVVGLLGTYCLPWPAVELAAEERMHFAAAAKPEADWNARSVRGSDAKTAAWCGLHHPRERTSQ